MQDEYLQFHFAKPDELAPLVGKFVAKEALNFPALCAKEVRGPRMWFFGSAEPCQLAGPPIERGAPGLGGLFFDAL